MIDDYGAIPKGEKAARDVTVPAQTSKDNHVRRFVHTGMEAGVTTDEMISQFKQGIVDGKFSFDPVTDKSAKAYAESRLRNIYDAKKDWAGIVHGDKRITKNDIAVDQMLYARLVKDGDIQGAMDVFTDLAEIETTSGQNVQAARMLKDLGGPGQLYYVDKVVKKVGKQLDQRFKGKAPKIQIPEDLRTNLATAETQDAIDTAVDQIMTSVAKQLPQTWVDKWNAWRYLAMLGNPRIHIRNLFGNAVFMPAVTIKDGLGAIIETAADKTSKALGGVGIERTKSLKALLPGTGGKYAEFSKSDYANVEKELKSGGKLNPSDIIRDRQQIFDNKTLETIKRNQCRWYD